MKPRAEDRESAILVMLLLNKDNDSSTEVTEKLVVQGTIEVVRQAVYHYGSNSKTILQVEYIRVT